MVILSVIGNSKEKSALTGKLENGVDVLLEGIPHSEPFMD